MRKATRTKKNSTANRKRKKGDRYEYDYPDLPSYGFVTLSLIKFTKTFLTKSFFPNLPLLCNRHFMHVPYGHTSTNSFSESENSSLKRSSVGPKPNDALDRSGMGNVRSSTKRFKNIQGNALNRFTQEDLNFEKRLDNHEMRDVPLENISTHIVDHMVSKCFTQYNLSRGTSISYPHFEYLPSRQIDQFFVFSNM